MTPDEATDREGFQLILTLIEHIDRRVRGMALDRFLEDKDEIDLTAYRLAIIGETAHKFSALLKGKHPEINWSAIYAMRNYLVHGYPGMNEERVWSAATFSLPALKGLCQAELGVVAG